MSSENFPNNIRFNRSTPPPTNILSSSFQSLSKVKGVHLYRARIRNTRGKPSPWKNCLTMWRASEYDSNLYHIKEIEEPLNNQGEEQASGSSLQSLFGSQPPRSMVLNDSREGETSFSGFSSQSSFHLRSGGGSGAPKFYHPPISVISQV